jgi:hypothetical protein
MYSILARSPHGKRFVEIISGGHVQLLARNEL